MSVAAYEYECSRAELLGVERPTWEEFSARKLDRESQEGDDVFEQEEINLAPEQAQDLKTQGEGMGRVNGGLEELNSILANTQHKIKKFKTVCGSFTNLMKLRGWKNEASSGASTDGASSSLPATPLRKSDNADIGGDLEAEVVGQVDRLDSLIGKAERAEISMSEQNKQMRRFLN